MPVEKSKLKEIVVPLVRWYEENKRDLPWRHNPTPFRVWISEIMLQQTRVDPVIPYYLRFMDAFPNVSMLASAPEDVLMKYWEGLGYYSRARNLQKAAKIIDQNGCFPKTFEEWLALPGIGNYTAGAICSIALGLPTPAVDGNVLRVVSRILSSMADISLESTKKEFTQMLREVYPENKTSEFTQALMELGATVCLPNGEPLCEQCPLREKCLARAEGKIDIIPVKATKKQRKIEEKSVLILRCGEKIAIHRRPEKGLLAKLWELPNLSGHLTKDELIDRFKATEINAIGESTHVFSHIEWKMVGYEVFVSQMDPAYNWVSIDELLGEKAIPSAFRHYMNYIKELRYEEI